MTQLDDLVERLTKETEGSRELDALIAETLGHSIVWKTANYTMELFPAILWKEPHPYAGMREPCPKWTESIDAAVTLVPDYLNIAKTNMIPMQWGVGTLSSDLRPEHKFCAVCRRAGITGNEPDYDASGATPAIALCIAALQARKQP